MIVSSRTTVNFSKEDKIRLLIHRTNGHWSNIGKKDFSETRLECRDAKKLRNQLIFSGCTGGTFEQLVCPRRGAFGAGTQL